MTGSWMATCVAGFSSLVLTCACGSGGSGRPAADAAGGSDAGASDAVGSGGDAPAAPPTLAQDLIQAALDAGEIDYGTSLLYRAYAAVNDPRLPAALRGEGSRDEDQGLWFEIAAARASLPAELADRLRPFTLRPPDPDSIYNEVPLPTPAAAPAQAARRGALTATEAAACPPAELVGGASARRWASAKSTWPVRVWFPCTGDDFDDQQAQDQADAVLAVIDRIWTPMTTLMGEPILDEGGPEQGGDGSIDIYLVDLFGTVQRGVEEGAVPSGGKGAALLSPPTVGLGGSGYIVFPRWVTLSPDFHSVVIHEFFHVLQMAYNFNGLWRLNATTGGYTAYWFMEASATWAMVHFDRTIAWPKREAEEILAKFFDGFQASHQSLHVPLPVAHAYEAYIWPFFMEQEAEDESIAQAWEALRSVTDWDAATAALDGVLPFAANFHRFAVRNVNLDFLPGDPLPADQRHVHTDALFPDLRPPQDRPVETLVAGQPATTAVSLKSLSARYYTYVIDDPTIRQVVVDFSAIAPQADLDVDALIRVVDRGWVLRDYSGQGKVTFCFNDPEQHISDLWLVLSDHATGFTDKAEGDLVVTPLTQSCGCGRAAEVTSWRATLDFEFIADDQGPVLYFTNAEASVKRLGHVTFDTAAAFPNPIRTTGAGVLHGTFQVSDSNDLSYDPNHDDDQHATLEGSGPALDDVQAWISVEGVPPYDGTTCTYSFGFNVAIETVLTTAGSPPVTETNDVVKLTVARLPVTQGAPEPGEPIVLSGVAQVPVHADINRDDTTNMDVYGLAYLLETIQTERGAAEGEPIGTATVIWEFKQLAPPPF